MPQRIMFMKSKWYPRPHDSQVTFGFGLETAVQNQATIIPILMHDEGLGAPTAYEAHPENAAFVEAGEPNCFPQSRINLIQADLEFNLTKSCLVTDDIEAVKVGFMPIFMAFIEDYTAIDELTALETQDVLEMQTESTDNQGFPLWNGVDMKVPKAGSNLLPANIPGLTATQAVEGITFSHGEYYDMLHFLTNGGKLKRVQGGLKWITLTRNRSTRKIRIRLRGKVKAMNKFTFFGVMCLCLPVASQLQFANAGDTTDLTHVQCSVRYRYNEWNEHFNMRKVT